MNGHRQTGPTGPFRATSTDIERRLRCEATFAKRERTVLFPLWERWLESRFDRPVRTAKRTVGNPHLGLKRVPIRCISKRQIRIACKSKDNFRVRKYLICHL